MKTKIETYSGFEYTGTPVEQYLTEVFLLLRELPHNFQVVMDTSSSDSEGGYGWHRYYRIAVYEIGERCRKCGTSTFDRHQNDFLSPIVHQHDWCKDERLVFNCTFDDIGFEQKGKLEYLKSFVEYCKTRR